MSGRTPHEKQRGKIRSTNYQMYTDQISWLGKLCIDARNDDGIYVSKADVIRALVDFAMGHDLNLEGVQSLEEIQERLREAVLNASHVSADA